MVLLPAEDSLIKGLFGCSVLLVGYGLQGSQGLRQKEQTATNKQPHKPIEFPLSFIEEINSLIDEMKKTNGMAHCRWIAQLFAFSSTSLREASKGKETDRRSKQRREKKS